MSYDHPTLYRPVGVQSYYLNGWGPITNPTPPQPTPDHCYGVEI